LIKGNFMGTTPLSDAIAAVRDEVIIQVADTAELVRAAYRLRYQVYCLERNYEAGQAGLEIDEFDSRARHVVLRHRRTGQVLGTARLVFPSATAPHNSLPVQRLCDPSVLPSIPLATAAEVSRFAIAKDRRGLSPAALSLMRLGLVQGLVRLSGQAGVRHWFAVMEPTLLRLLRSTAIHFQPTGPLVEHHGVRQPAYAHLGTMLSRMRLEQPQVWDFITDGGRFGQSGTDYLLAA
jgi:N-acyl-L-homoserine lactone synthetase